MPSNGPAAAWDRRRLADPHGQPDKALRVRAMFDAIAPTYELVNRLASVGLDRHWRREMVRLAEVRPEDALLDIACGTGDVCRAFAAARPAPRRIVGVDFAGRMLHLARGRSSGRIRWCQADALMLPFADASFSIATCAFGVRNFQSLQSGLREMWRILRPGGRAIILEFGMPSAPIVREMYSLYFRLLMPLAATVVSRDRSGAYRYLPRSVVSFCPETELVALCRRVGFSDVTVLARTFGVVSVFRARK